MKKIKVYFYDDKGYEIFTRFYEVETIEQMIDYVNETAFNNDVDTYFIETVDECNELPF